MVPRAVLVLGAPVAIAALVAIAVRTPAADVSPSAAVGIDNFHYTPATLVVPPGTTVT